MKIGNVECYGIIYKITNKVNGKIYIGQTKRGFKVRYCQRGEGIERVYKSNLKLKEDGKRYCTHLFRAIEKYGFEAFEIIEILDVAFSKQELDIKEKHYISLFNSSDYEYGYNILKGGNGFGGHSSWEFKTEEEKKEWRNKIGDAHRGKSKPKGNNPLDSMTEEEIAEWKRKISESKKGENHPNWGKHLSKETRTKQSEARKGKYAGMNCCAVVKYKVIDLDGNEQIMYKSQVCNLCSANIKGFLNITGYSFDKYVKPLGCVDIEKAKELGAKISLIEKLKKFNGWQIIEIDK